MRTTGIIVTIIGAIWLLIAFNMDVTVPSAGTYGIDQVVNLDLIARRQNHLFVAGLLALIGMLLVIFGGSREAQGANAGGQPQRELPPEPPTERDLALDAYRLWLAEKYGIERNAVFDRFVMDQQAFDTLDQALAEAHSQELQILAQEKQALAEAEKDAEEWKIAQAAEQARIDELWEQDKKKVKKVGIVVAAGLILSLPFTIPAIQKSRANAKIEAAREEAAKNAATLAEEKRIGDMLAKAGLKTGAAWSDIREDKDGAKSEYSMCKAQPAKLIRFRTSQSPEDLTEEFEKQLGEGDDPYGLGSLYETSHLTREWSATSKRSAIELMIFRKYATEAWLCISSKR